MRGEKENAPAENRRPSPCPALSEALRKLGIKAHDLHHELSRLLDLPAPKLRPALPRGSKKKKKGGHSERKRVPRRKVWFGLWSEPKQRCLSKAWLLNRVTTWCSNSPRPFEKEVKATWYVCLSKTTNLMLPPCLSDCPQPSPTYQLITGGQRSGWGYIGWAPTTTWRGEAAPRSVQVFPRLGEWRYSS